MRRYSPSLSASLDRAIVGLAMTRPCSWRWYRWTLQKRLIERWVFGPARKGGRDAA